MITTKRVLLVEDDYDDQETFIQALGHIRHVKLFNVANNAREAIEMLEFSHELPDAIVMDINMPRMGGIEYLSVVKNYPRLHRLPVIMLSSADQHRSQVLRLGARAFIKKPSSERQLRHELEQVLSAVVGPTMSYKFGEPVKSAILATQPQCYVILP